MTSVEKAIEAKLETYKHEGLVDAAARLCIQAEEYQSHQKVDMAGEAYLQAS
jgi:hypothetical protein